MQNAGTSTASRLADTEPDPLTPSSLLRLLHDEKSLSARAPVALCLDDYRVIVIDFAGTAHAGQPARWRSWTLSGLPEFCSRIARSATLALDARPIERHLQPGEPICGGPLWQLMWATAIHEPHPRPATPVDESTHFGLTRWPDFGAFGNPLNQMRLATAIAKRRLSAPEMVAQTGVPLVQVVAFLNACHWSGSLSTLVDPVTATTPSKAINGDAPDRPQTRAHTPTPTQSLSDLLRDLRNRAALRFDGKMK